MTTPSKIPPVRHSEPRCRVRRTADITIEPRGRLRLPAPEPGTGLERCVIERCVIERCVIERCVIERCVIEQMRVSR
jgi:hypothetical protein